MARRGAAPIRVALTIGAAAPAAAMAVALGRTGGAWKAGLLLLGIAGAACLAVGAVRRMPGTVATGMVLLGAEALIAISSGRTAVVDLLSGAVLLAAAEAAFLAAELHPRVEPLPGALGPRMRLVTALIAAGIVASELTLVLGNVEAHTTGTLQVAGVAAVILLATAVVQLSRASGGGVHVDR